MNREELYWLLQTIRDAETAARFMLAQYHCGRISVQMMTDVAQERSWVHSTTKQFMTTTTRNSDEYARTELPVAVA